ncbi:hypothetical protein EYZ11_000712 [Aspergillus tanneri]|uniref:Uncharacterized protein n=1 Tax=Aspergillus tanneri TaxID=1220188 RepID=A0A4S3JWD1_9EURO|nr:hypothetical protein EYZ11_000712 [Aspergillus tanneri]
MNLFNRLKNSRDCGAYLCDSIINARELAFRDLQNVLESGEATLERSNNVLKNSKPVRDEKGVSHRSPCELSINPQSVKHGGMIRSVEKESPLEKTHAEEMTRSIKLAYL